MYHLYRTSSQSHFGQIARFMSRFSSPFSPYVRLKENVLICNKNSIQCGWHSLIFLLSFIHSLPLQFFLCIFQFFYKEMNNKIKINSKRWRSLNSYVVFFFIRIWIGFGALELQYVLLPTKKEKKCVRSFRQTLWLNKILYLLALSSFSDNILFRYDWNVTARICDANLLTFIEMNLFPSGQLAHFPHFFYVIIPRPNRIHFDLAENIRGI